MPDAALPDTAIEDIRLPCTRLAAPAEWVDSNGHVNAAYFPLFVKDAAIAAHEIWEYGPSYMHRTGRSSFVLEARVTYLTEIKAGDLIAVSSRITGMDDKRLHLLFTLQNETTGRLSALVQYLTLHIDMQPAPHTATFPADLAVRLADLLRRHAAVPLPPPAEHLSPLGRITSGDRPSDGA